MLQYITSAIHTAVHRSGFCSWIKGI